MPITSGATRTLFWFAPEAVNPRLRFEPALDGLRAMAVLAVMVFHALPTRLSGGFLGVDVFFALSGYLITSLLVLEFDATGRLDLWKFYKRRWLRLGPALLLLLSCYGLAIWFFSPTATLNNQGADLLAALLYVSNWTRALDIKDAGDLGHTWSLAVEEQFYLLWPLLFWLLMRVVRQKFVLLASVTLLAGLSWGVRQGFIVDHSTVERIYNGLDTRAETLMWGATLAVLLNSSSINSRISQKLFRNNPIAWLALAIILTMFWCAQWTSMEYYQWGLSLIAVASLLLIGNFHSDECHQLKDFFANRYLVWIGSISYGLYLWHFPIYRMLIHFKIQDWGLLGLGMLLTFPLASISYYFLERPLLQNRQYKFPPIR